MSGRRAPSERHARLRLEPLEDRRLLASVPQLLKDLGTGDSSTPSEFVDIAGTLFFVANDGTHGTELWRSDGTSTGTFLVKDIRPGSNSDGPLNSSPTNLVDVGGTLFFSASGTSGNELWKSDGTSAGTVLVRDIAPGSSLPRYLTNVNGTLFFRAANSSTGYELWKSDGTSAGTVLVKDIRLGTSSSRPRNLANVDGTLFFSANDGATGYELWKSDGTSAGTVLINNIVSGSTSSNPQSLTEIGGTLFFRATQNGDLWRSDGTSAGTLLVKSSVTEFANVNGTLFLSANQGLGNNELWKSDGTATGTVLVKDIAAGSASSSPRRLTNVNGTLFFRAYDGAYGTELWKSDGTSSGTVLIKDIRPGLSGSLPDTLVNVSGLLFFTANDGTSGTELWKSDGTTAGTALVKDVLPFGYSSSPSYLTNFGSTLIFVATDGESGREIWITDGSSTGTVLVKDIRPTKSEDSSAREFTNVNGVAFFSARDGETGGELWKSDGTVAGTMIVKDIVPGIGYSSPTNLTNVAGSLFFSTHYSGVYALWKSDGTNAGTELVKQFVGSSESIANFVNRDGVLYFTVPHATLGDELWRSDGTSSGTHRVRDMSLEAPGASLSYLTNVNGTLFFVTGPTDQPPNSYQLWKSDGTSPGTVLVKEYIASPAASLRDLIDVDGTLFFVANDGSSGNELWRSDGTTAGTAIVKDVFPGADSGSPAYLVNVSGTLYFVANDGTYGTELWKSDGTSAGTLLVKDTRPGSIGSTLRQLTNVNGDLFFSRRNNNPWQLWKSDGTSNGTVVVYDELPSNGSSPLYFTEVNSLLFMQAGYVGQGDQELWQSDGTSGGTLQVADIKPGSGGSFPRYLANINGILFFSANDGTTGDDPWIYRVPGPSTVTGRHLFYNRSSFDGDNAGINTSDDAAIAFDKSAYLPGDGLAVFDNVSSYSRGINGIMIDLVGGGDHAAISLSTLANDFVFKVGNNNTPSSWAAAPTPSAVSVRTDFDGSGTDRVVITWTDGDIKNQWLEVQVLPTSRTGLTSTDVFFWGNKVGDVGSPTATSFTTTASGDGVEIVAGGLGPASGITDPRDIDRSGTITAAGDRGAAVANIGHIKRLDIGTGGPFAPQVASGGAPSIVGAAADRSDALVSAVGRMPALEAAPAARTLPANVLVRLDALDSTGRRRDAYFAALAALPDFVPSVGIAAGGDELEELLASLAFGLH